MLSYKSVAGSYKYAFKNRVFFTCHPDDFGLYFEDISNLILECADCVIWYRTQTAHAEDVLESTPEDTEVVIDSSEDPDSVISGVQLFVIPITKKLLDGQCDTVAHDLETARLHHIPILPIMTESGLDTLYYEQFGDIQYVLMPEEGQSDARFTENVNERLSELLAFEVNKKKIRDAFDARLFLSYRRCDKPLINGLMQKIHSVPAFRNVALWYDEYLTPGEKFNDEIKAMITGCDIMILCVSPDMVKKPNYVISTEYPLARNENKPVLPVKIRETDRFEVYNQFEALKSCLPEPLKNTGGDNYIVWSTGAPLANALLSALQGKLDGQAGSAEKDYYIGLAYLYGIDVEVNRELGVELITNAAENGYMDALVKLIQMYENGVGIARDREAKIRLIERRIAKLYKKYEEAPDFDNYINYSSEVAHLFSSIILAGKLSDQSVIELIDKHLIEFEHTALLILEEQPDSSDYSSVLKHQLVQVWAAETEVMIGTALKAVHNNSAAKEYFLRSNDRLMKMKYGYSEGVFAFVQKAKDIGVDFSESQGLMLEIAQNYQQLAHIESMDGTASEALKLYEQSLGILFECILKAPPSPLGWFLIAKANLEISFLKYKLNGDAAEAARAIGGAVNMLIESLSGVPDKQIFPALSLGFRYLAIINLDKDLYEAYKAESLSVALDEYTVFELGYTLFKSNLQLGYRILHRIQTALENNGANCRPLIFDVPAVLREWKHTSHAPDDPVLTDSFVRRFAGYAAPGLSTTQADTVDIRGILYKTRQKTEYDGLRFLPEGEKELDDALNSYAQDAEPADIIAIDCKTKRSLFGKKVKGTVYTSDAIYSSFFSDGSRVMLSDVVSAYAVDVGVRIKLADGTAVVFNDYGQPAQFLLRFLEHIIKSR